MEIFVNGLAVGTTETQLRELFSAFGEVSQVRLTANSFTNFRKGNGFVSMPNTAEGREAITQLQGKNLNGAKIVVNEARPRL